LGRPVHIEAVELNAAKRKIARPGLRRWQYSGFPSQAQDNKSLILVNLMRAAPDCGTSRRCRHNKHLSHQIKPEVVDRLGERF
jgi:hypothetical protein